MDSCSEGGVDYPDQELAGKDHEDASEILVREGPMVAKEGRDLDACQPEHGDEWMRSWNIAGRNGLVSAIEPSISRLTGS